MSSLSSHAAFADELVDWFWDHGVHRRDSYAIDLGDWPRRLYECRDGLNRIQDSLQKSKMAMAIWGPSQTGKSTLVSAYLDANAKFEKEESIDGSGSSLHWPPEGEPFFFMAPPGNMDDFPPYVARKVLNPYNKGADGSSCLTRFTLGSRTPGGDLHHVVNPRYPVVVHLVTPFDLWHALARGYNSECLGPLKGRATTWNLETFHKAYRSIPKKPVSKGAGPTAQRKAYEYLHGFCAILDDLAHSDMDTFSALAADEDAWRNTLIGLMSDANLASNLDLLETFAAKVLWDGYDLLTDYFRKMRRFWDDMLGPGGKWEGKTVYASLQATLVFLNMSASEIYFKPPPANPNSPEAVIRNLAARLRWQSTPEGILVGCDGSPGGAGSLASDSEAFSVMQGMVWELVVPMNPDHLNESTLKSFLQVSDILDFPGVGNEKKSLENRIRLDPDAPAQTEDGEQLGRPLTPQAFFMEILKRGKTASIVATYAKRLTIDGFSIFQAVDRYANPNADQIVNGINQWWKHFSPEFYENPKGDSPLPLNLGLTFWAPEFNKVQNPNDSNIYGNIEKTVRNLGRVSDPATCTTFAIHNHKSPHRDRAEIKVDFSPGSIRYQNLMADRYFTRQFERAVSRESFDIMLTERQTGGADYFFTTIREQFETLRSNPDKDRRQILAGRADELWDRLVSLLREGEIFPKPSMHDARIKELKAFKARALEAVEGRNETAMLNLNYALREMLSVSANALQAPPRKNDDITESFIRAQYTAWARHQAERLGSGQVPDWAILGIADGDALRTLLTAFIDSIEPGFKRIARWYRELQESVDRGSDAANLDTRPYLAIAMGNLLWGKDGNDALDEQEDYFSDDDVDEDQLEDAPEPKGRQCFYYGALLRDFLESRIDWLIRADVAQRMRPDNIPGDAELKELCARYDVEPISKKEPVAQ